MRRRRRKKSNKDTIDYQIEALSILFRHQAAKLQRQQQWDQMIDDILKKSAPGAKKKPGPTPKGIPDFKDVKRSKTQVKKEIRLAKEYITQAKSETDRNRGKAKIIQYENYQEAFLEGIEKYGTSPKKVHEHMVWSGHPYSYAAIRNLIQKIYGKRVKRGRPPVKK